MAAGQTAGDCRRVVCDGLGGTRSDTDDADPLVDGNPCTLDACDGGAPVNSATTGACSVDGGRLCGLPTGPRAATCVGCNVDTDCTGTNEVCDPAGTNTCVQRTCSDGARNGGETDVDCGGPCGPCVNGLGCDGGVACQSGFCGAGRCAACAGAADCPASSYCNAALDGGTCVPDLATGSACGTAAQCTSGFCVDGVCCGAACTGECMACAAAKTGGADGTCAAISAGQDPDNECPTEAASTCLRTGVCNGAGACQLYGATTVCGASTCGGGSQTDFRCSGAGQCVGGAFNCAPYACGATSCLTSCGTSGECTAANYCSGSACVARKANGQPCVVGAECTSNACVDGYCCDGPCTGSCSACSAAKKGSGVNGVCGAIAFGTDPDVECGSAYRCTGASSCQSCADGVRNGNETARDCGGGGSCGGCDAGLGCALPSDCLSGLCGGGVCVAPGCGNGFVDGAETCDDGNTRDLDGCSARCRIEPGYVCDGGACTSPTERNCNDGLDNDRDGTIDCADSDCALGCNATVGPCSAGETSLVVASTDAPKSIPDNNLTGVVSTLAAGGLGSVHRVVAQLSATHTWDSDLRFTLVSPEGQRVDLSSDNGSSGDNYTATVFHAGCPTLVTAGTAPFTGCFQPEGSLAGLDGGPAGVNWQLEVVDRSTGDLGQLNAWTLALCVAPSTCGDGVKDATEACDDGNTTNGDGCQRCAVEPGWGCSGTAPSVCTFVCGNGTIDATESCDDGATFAGDGCSPTCQVESGWACTPTCHTVCGDRVKMGSEACDDGNATSNDGCSALCVVEAPFCGDRLRNGSDECDDGNAASGDGCSLACLWETMTEIEPNNILAMADASSQVLDGPLNIRGSIDVVGDIDLYRVSVPAQRTARFELFDSSGVDCVGFATMRLTLQDAVGTTLKNEATPGAGIGGCGALVVPLAPGTYYLRVERSASGTQPNYFLQARFLSAANEVEPNDTTGTATVTPGLLTEFEWFGDHQVVTDTDVFSFYVPPGASVRAETVEGDGSETCESNGIDSTIALLSPTGVQLGTDGDNGRGFCSVFDGTGTTPTNSFAHALPGGAYYFIKVTSFSLASNAGNQFNYRLRVVVRNP